MSHGPAPLMAQLHKAPAAHGHRTGTAACTARATHYRFGAAAQHARRPERIARAPARHDGAALRGGGAARPTALEEKAAWRDRGDGVATLPVEGKARSGGEAVEREECGGARLRLGSATYTWGRSGVSDGGKKECSGRQCGGRWWRGEGGSGSEALGHARSGAGVWLQTGLSGRGGRLTLYGAGARVAVLPRLTAPSGDRALMRGPRRGKR
jgi:hypothetical protein